MLSDTKFSFLILTGKFSSLNLSTFTFLKSSSLQSLQLPPKRSKCSQILSVKKKKEEYDLIHIDISNDGDIYKFAIENYLNLAKKALLLEGGSEDRDKVEWMIKYNKTPINKYLKKISSDLDFKIIEKFPSMTIISTQ